MRVLEQDSGRRRKNAKLGKYVGFYCLHFVPLFGGFDFLASFRMDCHAHCTMNHKNSDSLGFNFAYGKLLELHGGYLWIFDQENRKLCHLPGESVL